MQGSCIKIFHVFPCRGLLGRHFSKLLVSFLKLFYYCNLVVFNSIIIYLIFLIDAILVKDLITKYLYKKTLKEEEILRNYTVFHAFH